MITRIDSITYGNYAEIERTIQLVPSGQTLIRAWFTVKRQYSDPDTDAPIAKTITTTADALHGQITDNGAGDTQGTLVFTLQPSETGLLQPYADYVYDIKVLVTNNKPYTPESGIICIQPSVHRGIV